MASPGADENSNPGVGHDGATSIAFREGVSPYSTGLGGATFERKVAVQYLAHLLLGDAAVELGDGRTVVSVAFQQAPHHPVDDLVVRASHPDEGEPSLVLAVGVRRAPDLVQSDESTQKLIREFVRAVVAAPSDGPEHRFALVVAGQQTHAKEFAELAGIAAVQMDAPAFFDLVSTPKKFTAAVRSRLDQIKALVKHSLIELDLADTEGHVRQRTWELLSRLTVLMPRLESPDESDWAGVQNSLVRVAHGTDLAGASRLRDRLVALANEYPPKAATINLKLLRRDAHAALNTTVRRPKPRWQALADLPDQALAAEILDVEAFLEHWSARSNPPLPVDLVLTGRTSQANQLREWLESHDGPSVQAERTLALRAASRREALLFACGTLVGAPSPQAERWLDRAVVVESVSAWRWITRQPATIPMILLPSFDDFDEQLGCGEHLAIIPRNSTLAGSGRGVLELSEPMPWLNLADRLQCAGLPRVEARRVAEQSQGYLEPLLRMLGADSRIPSWVAHEEHGALVAMLLVGAWTPSNEGDADVIRRLGADPRRVDELCTRLSKAEGTPIVRRGQSWCWSSLPDAWRLLLSRVSEPGLRSLQALAIEVLGEDDPKYEFPSEERMLAIVRGQVLSRSKELRQGIAESLLELALCDDELLSLRRAPR